MSQHRESLKQADHISTLHKLASLTVEEAQELASNIRATAKREAESEASRVLADAQSRAKEILESAEYTVKSQTRAASRLRKAAAAMEALRQAQLARFDEIDAEATDAQGVGPPGALYTDEVSLSRQGTWRRAYSSWPHSRSSSRECKRSCPRRACPRRRWTTLLTTPRATRAEALDLTQHQPCGSL